MNVKAKGVRELLPAWMLEHASPDAPSPPSNMHLKEWNDGFTPSGCDNAPCKMVQDLPRSLPKGHIQILDHAVTNETATALYKSAVEATVWGVYVSCEDLKSNNDGHYDAIETERRQLAKNAIQEFLLDAVPREDWENTHGIAVWVIASAVGAETEYHLDYAETVRYETNVIVPPIYGATLHVTDTGGNMDGGAFYANTMGLKHYAKYGYKTKLQDKITTDELERRMEEEEGWTKVEYAYRRAIICDGELPHFSGKVRQLPRADMKRVIVGFNLFPPDIGACVEKYPEHSKAFNRHVRLSQALLTSGNQWNLQSIQANPKQRKLLLLLAKKMKEQQEAKEK